jgi:hypothetical protein
MAQAKDLMYLLGDEQGRTIDASVLIADQEPVRGAVRAVFTDGVVLALPVTASLAIGEAIRVRLAVDGAPGVVVVRAVVRERTDEPHERRYRVRFASRQDHEVLPRELYGIFNRRRSERVRLTVPLRVVVSATGGAVAGVALIEGVSREGCSLLIDVMTEQLLADCDRVVLEVRRAQPSRYDDGPDWVVEAIIRNRQIRGDGDVRYGCELAPRAGHASDDVPSLTDYLLDYERERRARSA